MCLEEVIPEPLLARVREIAEQQNMDAHAFVEYVVRKYVDENYGLEPFDEDDSEDDSESSEQE